MTLIDVHRPFIAHRPVAGTRFNEHRLENEDHSSRILPASSTSRFSFPTPSSSYGSRLVSEGSVSSTQSYASAASGSHFVYHARQDSIGTPRRSGPRGQYGIPAQPVNLQREAQRRVRAQSPPPSPAAPIPLWEEPILFSGLHAFERTYTRELVSDDDEILIPRRPAPNAVWAHNPRQPVRANAGVQRMNTYTPDKKHAASTTTQNAFTFRRHPFPIGGPNPFRNSIRQNQRNSEEKPVQRPATTSRPPAAPRQSMINPHIIRGLERLIEDDDEEIILYLDSHPAAKEIAMAVADEEWRMEQEVRPRKHRPAVRNQRAYDQFIAERRLLSPPLSHLYLDNDYTPQPEPEAGEFDDFPVCEMSIAMGLHDRPRRAN